jgi:hypothetical protein
MRIFLVGFYTGIGFELDVMKLVSLYQCEIKKRVNIKWERQ